MGVVSYVTGGIPPERMIAGRDDMIIMATMAPWQRLVCTVSMNTINR